LEELEAGAFPASEVYEQICELFGWPAVGRRDEQRM
jgi:hypothetical protein